MQLLLAALYALISQRECRSHDSASFTAANLTEMDDMPSVWTDPNIFVQNKRILQLNQLSGLRVVYMKLGSMIYNGGCILSACADSGRFLRATLDQMPGAMVR